MDKMGPTSPTADESEKKREMMRTMYAEQKLYRLRQNSLMDGRLLKSTFATFRVRKSNEEDDTKNLRFCKRYATGFDEMLQKNQGLLLTGPVGTGKTFAAACIANHLLENGVPVVMTSFVKMLGLSQGFKRDEEEWYIQRMNSAKLLIIDDLGVERSTDFALERVYNIIDSRYRSSLPMILTTNLTLAEMKEAADIRYIRIYDRIFEVCFPMKFTGESRRRPEASRRYDETKRFLEGT